MAPRALRTARDLLGFAMALMLAPAAMSAQDQATVRVSATVITPDVLALQMSAAQAAAQRADCGNQRIVRVTVAYAGN